MSITIQTGHDSLVSLGMGVSEIASLFSLGKRLGNWMTAKTGDADLLALIDQDEMELLRRRGLLDLQRWNKQWKKSLELIVNSRPEKLHGLAAEKALGDLSRFTAIMTSVVAALDPFVDTVTFLKVIMKKLLIKLLGPTEYGEELLSSQLNSRVNAWRSSALVRGLVEKSRGVHLQLLKNGDVQQGFMPHSEEHTISEFLYWLLAQNTEEFVTTSSDVRGVAVCLTSLGFDELGIYYEHDVHRDRPYRVVYTPYAAFVRGTTGYRNQTRITSTTISLSQPEESLTKFPINQLTSTRCRFAWKYGIQASKAVRIAVGAEFVDTADPEGAQKFEELQYQLLDNGTQISRADTAHFPIASAFAFYPNKEFLEGLQLALNQESDETLGWLLSQTRDTEQETSINPHDISSGILGDDKVNSYTVFQAYMMGYYYSLFVDRLLDTSKLTIKTVDGAWGYRDTKFLTQMRKGQTLLKNTGMRIARTSMLSILSSLTTGEHLDSKHARRRTTPVLGLIGKRTLLVNSIIGSCDSPLAVGGFTILDCDTSGIPCDPHGLVKSGIPIPYMTGRVMQRPESMNKQAIKRLLESGPVEDFTRHIEADWEGNPDEMLLVFRYRGRRLGSVDPSDTDPLFWHSYLEPRVGPRTDDSSHWLHEAYECTINDILAGRLITPKPRTLPVLVQAFNKPCMRYALVGFYDSTGVVVCSDDVGYAATAAAETTSRRQRDNIIIAGSSMPRTVEPSEINCYRTRQEERGDPGFNNDDRLMVWNERLGRFANL